MPRGNFANLIQNRPTTPEQRRESARKAGLASAAKAKRVKLQREILREIMSCQCDDEEAVQALQGLGLEPTFANAANLSILRRAARGDVECLRYVRDTIGERPAEAMQLGILSQPVRSLELGRLTDAELEALAARADQEALPEAEQVPELPEAGQGQS